MASEWFYTRDNKSKAGPVSSAQLQALAKSGQLKPTDMVWKEGMAKWMPASAIKGLFNQATEAVTVKRRPVVSSASTSTGKARQQAASRPPQKNRTPRQVDEEPESSERRVGKGKAVFAIVGIAAAACVAGIAVLVAVFLNSGTPENEVAEQKGKGNPWVVAEAKKEEASKGKTTEKEPGTGATKDKTPEKKEPPSEPKDEAKEKKDPGTDQPKDKTVEKKEPPPEPKDKATEKEKLATGQKKEPDLSRLTKVF